MKIRGKEGLGWEERDRKDGNEMMREVGMTGMVGIRGK